MGFMIFLCVILLLNLAEHGKMNAFDATKESQTFYTKKLSFYFTANGITDNHQSNVTVVFYGFILNALVSTQSQSIKFGFVHVV